MVNWVTLAWEESGRKEDRSKLVIMVGIEVERKRR